MQGQTRLTRRSSNVSSSDSTICPLASSDLSQRIRCIQRTVIGEHIGLIGLRDLRIHAQELVRRGVVVAVDQVHQSRRILVGTLEAEGGDFAACSEVLSSIERVERLFLNCSVRRVDDLDPTWRRGQERSRCDTCRRRGDLLDRSGASEEEVSIDVAGVGRGRRRRSCGGERHRS